MKFDVYCDESNPEVLRDKSANKYLVLAARGLPGMTVTRMEKVTRERHENKKTLITGSAFKTFVGSRPLVKNDAKLQKKVTT